MLGSRTYGLPDVQTRPERHDGVQTVEQELEAYSTAAHSPKGTDILSFWRVILCRSHTFSLTMKCQPGISGHVPNYLCYRYGLPPNTGIRCSMRAGVLIE
jgi:hypothetical protein